jgi:hypothetical protein
MRQAKNRESRMTVNGLVEPDGATLIDPYVFAFGFFLMAAGLVMSQRHGDQRILLPRRSGLPFNLLQKTSGAETFAGAVLGFWIVGAWWSLWLPVLKLLSGFPVSVLGNARHRLPITLVAMATGLLLVLWAQGPTLIRMGIFARLFG